MKLFVELFSVQSERVQHHLDLSLLGQNAKNLGRHRERLRSRDHRTHIGRSARGLQAQRRRSGRGDPRRPDFVLQRQRSGPDQVRRGPERPRERRLRGRLDHRQEEPTSKVTTVKIGCNDQTQIIYLAITAISIIKTNLSLSL